MPLALSTGLRRAGRVYPQEREKAIRQQNDVEYAARLGLAASKRIGRSARASVLNAFQTHRNIGTAADRGLAPLRELLTEAMVYAWLRGQERGAKDVGNLVTIAAASPAYRGALSFLRKRLGMTVGQLAAAEAMADSHVVEVLATENLAISEALQKTVLDITEQGLHVRDGVKQLRKKWDKLGLSERNSYQLESIFRTQTELAYAAGRERIYADPDIDEILWGFKYVTAGDDRVRPSHMAIDGVTLPKDDPFWATNKPPNGFSCRCQAIALYEPRKVVEPPTDVTVNGEPVKVGADEGFAFDPGKLINPPIPPPSALPGLLPTPAPAPTLPAPAPKPVAPAKLAKTEKDLAVAKKDLAKVQAERDAFAKGVPTDRTTGLPRAPQATQDEWVKWVKRPEQRESAKAMREFTGPYYHEIRGLQLADGDPVKYKKWLRTQSAYSDLSESKLDKITARMQRHLDGLSKAYTRRPDLHEPRTLYRGLHQFSKADAEKLAKADTWQFRGWSSFSTEAEVAVDFGRDVTRHTHEFIELKIRTRAGMDVAKFTGHTGEAEIMVPQGPSYRIAKRKRVFEESRGGRKTYGWEIELEEM